MNERERYQRYLCSPEWWAKRNAVMERARGLCERCGREAEQVHHLTYARKYDERLDDLLAICGRCHNAIHNPVASTPEPAPFALESLIASERKARGIEAAHG